MYDDTGALIVGNGNGHSPARVPNAALRAASSMLVDRLQFARQTGASFGGLRDFYETFGYDRTISVQQYRDAYARGGIAKRIVEVMPKATWRGGFELIEDEDPKVSTSFEQTWDTLAARLRINAMFQRVDILSGLSTFAVLLIGAPGELTTPLPKGKPESILYIQPFLGGGGPLFARNRTMLDMGADCMIQSLVDDPQDVRFAQPEFYQIRRIDIASPVFQVPVHWSRVIHVADGCLDDNIYGQPVLENVWNLILDLDKVTGGGAEAFWLRANQGFALNVDKDAALTTAEREGLSDTVDELQHQIRRWMVLRKTSVEPLGSDVANFDNPADAILTQIAGSKGIPKRILTGSEMGELASSQDRENWRDQVNGRQTGYAGPYIIHQFVDRLIEYAYLPKPKLYAVRWSHIQVLTEEEKAAGASQWAMTNSTQGKPVFTTDEIRDHWYAMEPLTDEQIAKETPVAPEAEPEAAPVAEPEAAKGKYPRAAEEHTYSSTQVDLPDDLASAIRQYAADIPDDDLYVEPKTLGGPGSGRYPKGSSAETNGPSYKGHLESDALQPVYRKGYDHGQTGYGFQKSIAGRKGSVEYDAYKRGYDDGVDDGAEGAFRSASVIAGREDTPHITVKYGLHTSTPRAVAAIIKDFGPVEAWLGRTAIFELDDHDVLHVQVDSPDLERLNALISESLDHTDTHPDYTPHATIAYLKPGRGIKYLDDDVFEGESARFVSVVFSNADGKVTEIPLEVAEVKAAEEHELLRVLEAAILANNTDVIDAIIGVEHKTLGGAGSGNFGHGGRPGEVGGSSSDAGEIGKPVSAYPPSRPDGRDTQEKFSDGKGHYTLERTALHQAIVDKYMRSTTPIDKPVATILGGGMASGKTTLVNQEGIGKVNTVLVNVDEIRNDLPEYAKDPLTGKSPSSTAATHDAGHWS